MKSTDVVAAIARDSGMHEVPPSPAGPLNFSVPYVRVQAILICKNCGVTVPKASALDSNALEGRGSGSLAPYWRAH